MLPVTLIIKGLYSYQEQQKIDFERLTGARLFGIFGNVGSGKSSILEAITYALYGESERLNKRDNRGYNMMNLKSSELLIDFEFEAGSPSGRYRAIVSGKRHGKKFDTVYSFERKALVWKNGSWIPFEPEKLPGIIGLSYPNFKRTIIIPQGKFKEFLELGDKERTTMLEEIFNLQRFDLQGKTGELDKKNEIALSRIEGELEGFKEISPEAIELKKKEKALLEGSCKQQEKEVKQLDADFRNLQKVRELFFARKELEAKLQELKAQREEIENRRKELQDYELCVLTFKDLLSRHVQLEKEFGDIIEEKNRLESEKAELRDKLISENKILEKILRQHEGGEDQLEKKINDAALWIRILNLQEKEIRFSQKLKQSREIVGESTRKLSELKISKAESSRILGEKKQKLPDLSVLGSIKHWFSEKNGCIEILGKQQKLNKEISTKIEGLGAVRERILQDSGLLNENKDLGNLKVKDLKIELKALRKKKEEEITHLEKQVLEKKTQHELHRLVTQLKEGEPCPLCGSEHHPQKLSEGDISLQVKKLEEEKAVLRQFITRLEETGASIEGLVAEYKGLNERLNDCMEDEKVQQAKLEALQQAFVWEAYRGHSEEQIDSINKEAGRLQQEIRDLEKALAEKENEIEKHAGASEEKAKEVNLLELDLKGITSEVSALKDQLKVYSTLNGRTSTDEWEQLLDELKRTLESFSNARKEKESLEKALEFNEVKMASKNESEEKYRKELERLKNKLDEQVDISAFDNLGEIMRILEKEIDTDKERKAITEFDDRYKRVVSLLEDAEAKLEGQEFNEEEYETAGKKYSVAEAKLKELRDNLAIATDSVRKLEEQAGKKEKLVREIERLEKRRANFQILKSMFKAKGFVEFISSVNLRGLVERSNQRFHPLTRQQLRLELGEDNSFLVRDFLNDGKLRSVKTLSGGQTFQASLSLALALAENITTMTRSEQNFFFLDEGFGSQDKESLNVVFDTLKALRKENRIVGVISHVEELQQEINVFLEIENDREKGSQVKSSWES